MSITDELRKWGYGFCGDTHDVVTAIADRIDAEYQKIIRELNNFADASVFLPVDADGEHIHIGDKVTLYGRCVYEVDGIHIYKDSVSVSCSGVSGCGCDSANNFHHYHAPTVEDVLREMLDAWGELPSNATNEAIIAEYAAKLRLAGDAE